MHNAFCWYEKLLNSITTIRAGEGKSCMLLALKAALIMCSYYLLKVIREPLILAQGGAELKSYATAMQAGLLLFIVPCCGYLYQYCSRFQKQTAIINAVLIFFIINLLIFVLLYSLAINIAVAFYVWLGIFAVLMLAQFWAFAADVYNVRSGQRLFVVIAIGAALGAWLGAVAAGQFLPHVGVLGIMIIAALLLLVTLLLTDLSVNRIPQNSVCHYENTETPASSHITWRDGFAQVFRHGYLRLIAVFIVLLNFVNSCGEYILAHFVIRRSEQLVAQGAVSDISLWQGQFYSTYFSMVTLLSLALQLFLVSRLFKWIGISGAIVLVPSIVALCYMGIFVVPVFTLVHVALVCENSLNYSIVNTARQALFLPVPRQLKYIGKTTIDTFFFRFGDLIYGAMIFILVAQWQHSVQVIIAINMLSAFLLAWVAWRIGRHYKFQLRQQIKNSPPYVAAMLPSLTIPAGQASEYTVSESTFQDPDVGDALTFKVENEKAERMPAWVKFDRHNRRFTFHPPQNSQGQLHIRIIAADYEGLSVSSTFIVHYGPSIS